MIYMLIGIQGSGKSTFAKKYAKEWNCKIISTYQVRSDNPGIKEEKVWETIYKTAYEITLKNEDAIFDATNITPKVRKRFFDEVEKYGKRPKVGAYYFSTDKKICYDRVVERNKNKNELFLPPEVVYSYSEKLIPPTLKEGFIFIKEVKED